MLSAPKGRASERRKEERGTDLEQRAGRLVHRDKEGEAGRRNLVQEAQDIVGGLAVEPGRGWRVEEELASISASSTECAAAVGGLTLVEEQ